MRKVVALVGVTLLSGGVYGQSPQASGVAPSKKSSNRLL